MTGVTDPCTCCGDDEQEPPCSCTFHVSPSRCTVSWSCILGDQAPHAVRVVTVDEDENILTVVSTEPSGFVNPPLGVLTRYRLLVCCSDPVTSTLCLWRFDGTDWVLISYPEDCDCTAIPLVPTPAPDEGDTTEIPCGELPP